MKNVFWIIVSLFSAVLNTSCMSKSNAVSSSDSTIISRKDSVYLSYTISQMIKARRSGFEGSFDSTYNEIDKTVYSADSSKFISLIVLRQYPERELLEPNEEYKPFYVGKAMIGYKINDPEVWRIYPFDRFIFESFNKDEVINGLRLQFFERLKSSTFPGSSRVYEYNVDDPAFWTGPFWKRENGAYPFELGLKGNKGISYPDTLK